MITDQLRRDNLSWIETHKTTDCLFRSHSQFFCTFFLPMVPDTYTGILTRAVRVWNSSFRLWRKMWITLLWLFIRTKSSRVGRDVAVSCKKSTTVLVFKRLHIGMCDYLHWFILSCTCTYLTLAPCFFCCCCCCCFFFFKFTSCSAFTSNVNLVLALSHKEQFIFWIDVLVLWIKPFWSSSSSFI